jgi:hypothetical protein
VNATHTRLQGVADRLIQENGRSVSIRKTTTTIGDPNKPWGSTSDSVTTSDTATYGVFFDEEAGDVEARLNSMSRLVLAPLEENQAMVYIPGSIGVVPDIADQLVDGSRVMEVLKVEKVNPGVVTIMYILRVEN